MDVVDGAITVTPTSLTVTLEGAVLLSDNANPVAPAGWWEAVDQVEGHAPVLFLPAGTPFEQPAFAAALDRLAGQRSTAQAILRVTH